MKVLIIEDEPLAAKRLIRLLREVEPTVEIAEVLQGVNETIDWLQKGEADLIFLDIHLSDGNSFSIFEQVEIKSPVIFVTAFDQYAVQAFRVNSIDYLLKPIEQEELADSMQRYHNQQLLIQPQQIIDMFGSITQQQDYQKRFIVTSGDKIKSVQIEEVAYFFGQQKYVFLITRDNRKYIIDYTLGKLEEKLDPDRFFRINRQFIISFEAITNMFTYSKSRIKVELEPEPELEAIVSIDKSKKFKDWLNR